MTKRLAFSQSIKTVDLGMGSPEEQQERACNVFLGYIVDEVPQDFIDEVYALFKQMKIEQMQDLVTYDTFREEVQRMEAAIVKERELHTVKINRTTKSWVCSRKHRIAHYPGGMKQLDHTGFDMREVVKCAHCKADFIKKEKGYSSCLKGCNIYMCPSCSACSKKHILKWWIGFP